MVSDLVLDPAIRVWVFLPIVIITLLVGILRHFMALALLPQIKLKLQQLEDGHLLLRAKRFRENCDFIPKTGFLIRKTAFNREDGGYLIKRRPVQTPKIIADPAFLADLVKTNLTNVTPMIAIGGWINWTFSGFITTKVPFPLTLRFKSMLQREIEMNYLDPSWVSSISWYFLNVFGSKNILGLLLEYNTEIGQEEAIIKPFSLGQDLSSNSFKSEWEAIEILQHEFAIFEPCSFLTT